MKYLTFSILFLSGLIATATPAPIESIKFDCPGSKTEVAVKLKAMEDQVSLWTQANPDKADQTDLASIFSPHLLSDTNTMNMIESSCWLSMNDFIDKPSEKHFEYWSACLSTLDLQKVPQFQEIKSCWSKVSKKNTEKGKKSKL